MFLRELARIRGEEVKREAPEVYRGGGGANGAAAAPPSPGADAAPEAARTLPAQTTPASPNGAATPTNGALSRFNGLDTRSPPEEPLVVSSPDATHVASIATAGASASATGKNVVVAVRVRPLSATEAKAGARIAVRCDGRRVSVEGGVGGEHSGSPGGGRATPGAPPVSFAYDVVQDDEANLSRGMGAGDMQRSMYEAVAVPAITELMEGYNTTILAYGQTGSGKTHTMLSSEDEVGAEGQGLIPRMAAGLFERIAASGELLSEDQTVEVSMLEIYQERVADLLAGAVRRGAPPAGVSLAAGSPHSTVWAQIDTAGRRSNLARARARSASSKLAFSQASDGARARAQPALAVREHPRHGPSVEGLVHVRVRSARELLAALELGTAERTTSYTAMNDRSSRSHAVFTITLRRSVLETGAGSVLGPNGRPFEAERVARCSLVDLAGSERQDRSGATGAKLRESSMINRSLTLLNDVIVHLSRDPNKDSRFVPYRNSVLTWLLKESLGGNAKTVMVATVSPCAAHVRETVSTLRYAARAKGIRNSPEVNEDPRQARIRQLEDEVRGLRKEVRRLKTAHGEGHEKHPHQNGGSSPASDGPLLVGRMAALEERMKRLAVMEANVRKARTWAFLLWQEVSSKGFVDSESVLAFIDDVEEDDAAMPTSGSGSGSPGEGENGEVSADEFAAKRAEERRARRRARRRQRFRNVVNGGLRYGNQQAIAALLDEGGKGHHSS